MSVLTALAEVRTFLDEQNVPYAVIGGLAVQQWGEPRVTRDVDVVVMVPMEGAEEFFEAVVRVFRPRRPDAIAFAQHTRVLLVAASDGTAVDISLGIPGYEEEVTRRSVEVSIPEAGPVRVASAEDLIIHKCVAGRPRDAEDVERVLRRQGPKLDLAYVRQWLREFSQLVDQHDVEAFFEEARARAGAAPRSLDT